jgi:aminopeptidase N
MYGETVTSEDFRLDELAVVAPEWSRVLGTGSAVGTAPGPMSGTTVHRFRADAVRDVAVSVGRFDVVERQVGDTRVHVGVPEHGSRVDAEGWADAIEQMTRRLEGFLGPYPYPDLWACVLPPLDDGVEFPTALQLGDVGRDTVPALVAHEVAHMWFYALLGNNQARHPWIDESFATYAQARAAGQLDSYARSEVDRDLQGALGQPMQYWADRGNFDRFVRGVYDQGAAALIEGRRRAGDDVFDKTMRAYIDTNAHRVVEPADVEKAFQNVPAVVDVLRDAGGLPGRD